MITKHRLTILWMLLCTALGTHAQWKEKHPAADIKVSYNYHQIFLRGGKELTERDILYDEAGFLEFGCYTDPFSEQHWQIGDSIKQVLGYECQMAEMDYHGRHWTVWFATDIPLQDGPWKFHGLPGLILEASEPSGQHTFVATGIEASDATMVPIYNKKKYAKMDRKAMLKDTRNARDNSMSMFRAQTGLDLGVSDAPVTEETRQYDFLETDYH